MEFIVGKRNESLSRISNGPSFCEGDLRKRKNIVTDTINAGW